MSDSPYDQPADKKPELDALAHAKPRGLLAEVVGFLRHNKKWWLTPIIVALLLMGILVALGGSAVAPFIYTLF